jgi:hypothetical protein
MGLISVWNISFLGLPARALLPYCQVGGLEEGGEQTGPGGAGRGREGPGWRRGVSLGPVAGLWAD